jgi:2-succinyl-6-hydroxy-2,4-cyclohexadiene-1-carboxylate synthase
MPHPSKLHIERAGDTDTNVVFLHGFIGSGSDWAAVRDAFAAEHRCWFVDLPGHGGSVGRLADEAMDVE